MRRRARKTQVAEARRRKQDVDRFADPPASHRARDVLDTARAVTEQTHRLRAQSAALADAHRAVQEANQRFVDLYDFVPIPYVIASNLGVILHVNESGLKLLGGEREWIVGRPLISYVDRSDMQKVLDTVAGSSRGSSQPVEVRLRAFDGPRAVQIVTRRSSLPGSPTTLHVAIVDLTEIQRLEEERRRAEQARHQSLEAERVARFASEAKDEFLAMLSHELRTPLTPILAATDWLASRDALPDQLRGKIEVIRRNVRAEACLIDDLLDVARITKKKLVVERKPTDVHRIVADVVDGWKGPLAARRICLDVHLDASAHWVDGDAGRLGQILRNLISNAAQFSDDGSRIRVQSEDDEGRIRVTVVDNGAGMTEAQMQSLFTPFVHTAPPSPRRGLGLGLIISRAIVEAHEGTLEIWSAGLGSGTTVHVDLPTIPEPATEEAAAVAETPGSARTAAVLLVEDDRDSAEMLATLLSVDGFQVRIASSVHAALALAGSCDVLVSDIALPDGSGLDLMREVHARTGMRGVAISGYGSSEDVRRSLEAGFEEHLRKPIDLDQLLAAVRRLLVPR